VALRRACWLCKKWCGVEFTADTVQRCAALHIQHGQFRHIAIPLSPCMLIQVRWQHLIRSATHGFEAALYGTPVGFNVISARACFWVTKVSTVGLIAELLVFCDD